MLSDVTCGAVLFSQGEIVEGEVWTGEKIEKHFWVLLGGMPMSSRLYLATISGIGVGKCGTVRR